MRIEFMPGMTNDVRFPLEVRVEPSLELFTTTSRRTAVRWIWLRRHLILIVVCTKHGGAADLAMAEHILNNVPPSGVRAGGWRLMGSCSP